MSTQDDDLKLEPPQVQPPAPQPPAPVPAPTPPAAPPAAQPSAGAELEPGRGRPMVEGPPMSVDEPVSDQTINRTAAIAGIGLLGIGLIVAVILLLVIVFAVCTHH